MRANPDIVLRLGTRVEDFVLHAKGSSVACRRGAAAADEHGIALIGADGLWSGLRARLGQPAPEFRQRTAWRALVPGGCASRRNSALPTCSSGSGRTRMSSTIR